MNRILLVVLKNFWIVPGAWFKLRRYAKHSADYSYEEKYKHIRFILNHVVDTGNIQLEISGTEHFPEKDGFLMCGNHQGMFDPLAVVYGMERPFAAVLKKELYKIPFLNEVVRCTDSLPMDREDVRQSMKVIMKVTEELKSGRNFLIFPEGTRSRKGNEMLEFHAGTFKCVTKSKCPIVPFALVDSFKVMDQKGCKPVKVVLKYLEPIYYEEYKDMSTAELAAFVQGRIAAAIKEIIQDA